MKVAYGLAGLRVQIFSVGGEIAVDFTVWCVHILVTVVPIGERLTVFPSVQIFIAVVHVPYGTAAIAVEIARHDRDNRNVASRS